MSLIANSEKYKNPNAISIPPTARTRPLSGDSWASNGDTVPPVNQAAATVLKNAESDLSCSEFSFRTNLLYH